MFPHDSQNFVFLDRSTLLGRFVNQELFNKILNFQQKLRKAIPQSIEFQTSASKDLTKVNQTQYVIQDEPITIPVLKNSLPIYCEKTEDKIILQIFDTGLKTNITPPTDKKNSLKKFNSFPNSFKQIPFCKTKSPFVSSMLLNNTDYHIDFDYKKEKRNKR